MIQFSKLSGTATSGSKPLQIKFKNEQVQFLFERNTWSFTRAELEFLLSMMPANSKEPS